MRRSIHTLVLALVLSAALFAQDKVALATKVAGQVTLTKGDVPAIPLKRGTMLGTGDKIITGSDGIAVLVFIDDRTILRIQRNTILDLELRRLATGIDKQINMQFGKLKAEVAEQRQGQFLIATPTSVASVKGTEFWATSDPITGDIFLGISGLIEVQNLISNEVIEVGGGQVGTSTPDGETSVTVYVLLVGDLITVADNLLTMEATEIGEGGESFNGSIALNASTSYAGPAASVGVKATVSGTLNDDGSVTAIQVEIQEVDDAVEEEAEDQSSTGSGGDDGEPADGGEDGTGTNELRIQLEDANGDIKEVIIIFD
ncbi:MAG: FecR domain-containing protein [Candidatus Marinimicrobia bacterium]|nr:FecR domain-containing protein [Candidatus Neomarinimicrobiota bacterium]